jgi:hypothetical protein
MAQLTDAFGDNPGFVDQLIETLGATNTSAERTEAIQLLCENWRYPEEEVFQALVPASWLAHQQSPESSDPVNCKTEPRDDRGQIGVVTPRPHRARRHLR